MKTKKRFSVGLALGLVALLAAACVPPKAPVVGFVYTDLKAFETASGEPLGPKMGEGTCKSIMGIVATGDCSIDAAARKAKITKISHVDYHTENLLGIIAKVTVQVYGK
jgi:hypothetical protein